MLSVIDSRVAPSPTIDVHLLAATALAGTAPSVAADGRFAAVAQHLELSFVTKR